MLRYHEAKATIQEIVSVFETGRPDGSYGAVAVLRDGAGISYGKHQATDRSGSLDEILVDYVSQRGEYHEEVSELLPLVAADRTTLWNRHALTEDQTLILAMLRRAGDDPTMQRVQDEVFDRRYWEPAHDLAHRMGLSLPLSWLIVYDTCIHSGPGRVATMRAKFAEYPPALGGDERAWCSQYIDARRRWLLSRSNSIVHKTVYRMDVIRDLIKRDEWLLEGRIRLSGIFRGVTVGE